MMGSENYHYWTGADIKFLRENYGILTVEQLAKAIGVKSVGSVRDMLGRYHIRKVANVPKGWSKEQYDIFLAEYETCKTLHYLSRKIDKSLRAIYMLAYLRGLSRKKTQK